MTELNKLPPEFQSLAKSIEEEERETIANFAMCGILAKLATPEMPPATMQRIVRMSYAAADQRIAERKRERLL